MARKDLLANLIAKGNLPVQESTSEPMGFAEKPQMTFKSIGALGAVTRSIDALAAKADLADAMEKKLAEGAVVVDLDPDLIESSFVRDRVTGEDQEFLDLVEAIRVRGQDSPILVRPHPDKPGHYQIAFGHRRARAARLLGRPVRAVVKELADRDHVIAQGQENSARSDLSFIERAMFAERLEQRGFDRETIMLALNADKTTVSKMLSVTRRVPAAVLEHLDAARSVGRDRWHDLSLRFESADFAERARDLVHKPDFLTAEPDQRFERLEKLVLDRVERTAPKSAVQVAEWRAANNAVRVRIKDAGKRYTMALEAENASAFGAYLLKNLDQLYETFEQDETNPKNGD